MPIAKLPRPTESLKKKCDYFDLRPNAYKGLDLTEVFQAYATELVFLGDLSVSPIPLETAPKLIAQILSGLGSAHGSSRPNLSRSKLKLAEEFIGHFEAPLVYCNLDHSPLGRTGEIKFRLGRATFEVGLTVISPLQLCSAWWFDED